MFCQSSFRTTARLLRVLWVAAALWWWRARCCQWVWSAHSSACAFIIAFLWARIFCMIVHPSPHWNYSFNDVLPVQPINSLRTVPQSRNSFAVSSFLGNDVMRCSWPFLFAKLCGHPRFSRTWRTVYLLVYDGCTKSSYMKYRAIYVAKSLWYSVTSMFRWFWLRPNINIQDGTLYKKRHVRLLVFAFVHCTEDSLHSAQSWMLSDLIEHDLIWGIWCNQLHFCHTRNRFSYNFLFFHTVPKMTVDQGNSQNESISLFYNSTFSLFKILLVAMDCCWLNRRTRRLQLAIPCNSTASRATPACKSRGSEVNKHRLILTSRNLFHE